MPGSLCVRARRGRPAPAYKFARAAPARWRSRSARARASSRFVSPYVTHWGARARRARRAVVSRSAAPVEDGAGRVGAAADGDGRSCSWTSGSHGRHGSARERHGRIDFGRGTERASSGGEHHLTTRSNLVHFRSVGGPSGIHRIFTLLGGIGAVGRKDRLHCLINLLS